jgi:hypothetical protein
MNKLPNIEDVIKWGEAYDKSKYPVGIYEELVVEQMDHSRKFELMGAWKIGSLRMADKGTEYTDKNGQSYEFTKRWKKSAPVGYDIWNHISKNQINIRTQIPELFPEDKPSIVNELEGAKGFGYIWTVFVLHCFYPNEYPLYDQHVYRAYYNIALDDKKEIDIAPNTWEAYKAYKSFFIRLLNETKLPFWELDRALWVYGKNIKKNYKLKSNKDIKKDRMIKQKINLDNSESNAKWLQDHTLGGKAKPFSWRMDEDNNMLIKRNFKGKTTLKSITERELELVHKYVTYDKWVDLANSVTLLENNTEKDGLGKFLYQHLKWSGTEQQLSSHLGVIFLRSEIWRHNGKKKGIQFIRQNDDWKTRLSNFYNSKINYL